MPFPRQMAEISSFIQKQFYMASLFYKEIVYIVFHLSVSQSDSLIHDQIHPDFISKVSTVVTLNYIA